MAAHATLPVRLAIGDTDVQVGELVLTVGARSIVEGNLRGALAGLLRAAADHLEAEEVDGASADD